MGSDLRQASPAARHLFDLADVNAPGQLIVSGTRDAIARLGELAKAAGARRLLPLNVGGPFHSSLMRPAAEPLAKALAAVAFSQTQTQTQARVPVVLNASAAPS